MSIFGGNFEPINEALKNPKELEGWFIIDEVSRMSDEEKEAFVNSEEAKALEEAGLIGRRTLIKLTKNNDLVRRQKMAAFQLAKEANDPLWTKLVKNRIIERKLIAAIVKKYGNKSKRVAMVSQKAYLKANKITDSFKK